MLTGYLYRGTLLGVNAQPSSFMDEEGKKQDKIKYILGLQSEVMNDFGGTDTRTDKFIVPPALVLTGLHNHLKSLKSKQVEIKFRINKWDFNGRSGETQEVLSVQEVAKG